MAIEYRAIYHEKVVSEDITKISKLWKSKIQEAIETKLIYHPEVFGKPLRTSLKNYRKLRVGDYRIIFRIDKEVIKIFMIGHRKDLYSLIKKRN